MSKKKSLIILSTTLVIMLFLAVFSVLPTFSVGIYDYKSPMSNVKLGLDLKGGVYVTFQIDEESTDAEDINAAISSTAQIMQDRLAQKGYTEAVVATVNSTDGAQNIRVEIPDISDPDEVFDILAKPAKLEIRALSEDGELVTDPTNIISATPYYDTASSSYAVSLRLNATGRSDMSAATQNMSFGTDMIYFMLDGEVISSPTVNGHISGEYSSISSIVDFETAEQLAIQISSGAYPISFVDTPVEMRVISPTLGEEAIQTVIIAGIVSIVLIVFFIVFFYGMFGLAASFALLGYAILIILALAYLPFVQLTLPGIAGIILGIGMAVDANIIMFERIKDEYRSGKSFSSAYQDGYKRSLSAILDSNITTIIGGIVLWLLATGSIQGFAITLVFSVAISLISALVLTRVFIKLLIPIVGEKPDAFKLKRMEVEQK